MPAVEQFNDENHHSNDFLINLPNEKYQDTSVHLEEEQFEVRLYIL